MFSVTFFAITASNFFSALVYRSPICAATLNPTCSNWRKFGLYCLIRLIVPKRRGVLLAGPPARPAPATAASLVDIDHRRVRPAQLVKPAQRLR